MAEPDGDEEALRIALRGMRSIVGVAAASLAPTLDQVTLPQFRALVLLRMLGPLPAGSLAARLGITPSTGTRLAARLAHRGWLRRVHDEDDRRVVTLELTAKGDELVFATRARREDALRAMLQRLGPDQRGVVLAGLTLLVEALDDPVPEALIGLAMQDDPAPDGASDRL